MATLTSALNTAFTPAVGDFIVQVSGAAVILQRRNTTGAAWVEVGRLQSQGVIVSNPIAAAEYRFVPVGGVSGGTAVVQADQ